MGILDSIVEWLATQVANILDLFTGSVLNALGCSTDTFIRYFPAAETFYSVFVGMGIGFVLLNLVWQLFQNFGVGIGLNAEEPIKLLIRSVLFIFLIWFSDEIMDILLNVAGTPYSWVVDESLPGVDFASFGSTLTVVVGSMVSGSVGLIVLILLLVIAWNYIKLLLIAAERYITLGVLIFTAPLAFATGASQDTENVFKSWCRLFASQLVLLLMNAWCLRLFIQMMGQFLSNPLAI